MPKPTFDGEISRAQAVQMQKDFIANQYDHINRAMSVIEPGFTDNREFIFSLDKIENYVTYVRDYAAQEGIPIGDLGLHFYFGAQKVDGSLLPKSQLFIVATNNGIDLPGVSLLDYGEYGEPPKSFVM